MRPGRPDDLGRLIELWHKDVRRGRRDCVRDDASLYVDGLNPTRAYDAYRKLGFELAFETEVWEATFR